MIMIEKEHKKSSLMSQKKEDLVRHIMFIEHNNNVLNQTLQVQADNFLKLTGWIPVSSGQLPYGKVTVLAWCYWHEEWTTQACYLAGGEWYTYIGGHRVPVLAWMPEPGQFIPQNEDMEEKDEIKRTDNKN